MKYLKMIQSNRKFLIVGLITVVVLLITCTIKSPELTSNTWFYTLSTVVQGLSALFAIAGTFLIFKLQTLNSELRDHRNKAIRTLVYLEKSSAIDYTNLSIVNLSKKFNECVKKLNLDKKDYGIFDDLVDMWIKFSDGFSKANGTSRKEYLDFLIKEETKVFLNKVNYRINLYKYAGLTSGVLLVSILLGLDLLSGLMVSVGYKNLDTFHVIITLSNLSVFGVFYTIIFALLGDND